MAQKISRRDFLKLASILPLSLYLPRFIPSENPDKPNILVIIFDAWSATNTSLYDYPRNTTPNINKLADRAIVYHNHYASGHYTYPSTASLLTGVLPWTHKGYWINDYQKILKEYKLKNIFHLLPEYFRSAYTHNTLADGLLQDMVLGIDNYLPKNELSINPAELFDQLFHNDQDISSVSWIRNLELLDKGFANSVFLSKLNNQFRKIRLGKYVDQFPRGLPAISELENFVLETAVDWTFENLKHNPTPFFSYIHLLPPHHPYRTRIDFIDRFKSDGYLPAEKPLHPLGEKLLTFEEQIEARRTYDEFILYADAEFQRLFEKLSRDGILENTIIILTSDHGEMFERGIPEHLRPSFHKPLMHIPLLIFLPGQEKRVDIHSLTTTVDLLPTILHLTGNSSPAWLEGELLPPFNPEDRSSRTVFGVDFRRSPKTGPLSDGTIMICSGTYKFTYLFGTKSIYNELPDSHLYELYDVENDPEELYNLFDPNESLSQSFLDMMEIKLTEKNLSLARYNHPR